MFKINTFLYENLKMDQLMCIQSKTKIMSSMTDYVQYESKTMQ